MMAHPICSKRGQIFLKIRNHLEGSVLYEPKSSYRLRHDDEIIGEIRDKFFAALHEPGERPLWTGPFDTEDEARQFITSFEIASM
jgi:hypothetical protein